MSTLLLLLESLSCHLHSPVTISAPPMDTAIKGFSSSGTDSSISITWTPSLISATDLKGFSSLPLITIFVQPGNRVGTATPIISPVAREIINSLSLNYFSKSECFKEP